MADDHAADPNPDLEAREPTLEDLRDLCRALNERGAEHVVIGGFAMRATGYNRTTMDVDLLVATSPENEARVFAALATLPDNAVRELQPGEIERYSVVRVADEIVVDLMRSAGGIDYAAAMRDTNVREVDGVTGPDVGDAAHVAATGGARDRPAAGADDERAKRLRQMLAVVAGMSGQQVEPARPVEPHGAR